MRLTAIAGALLLATSAPPLPAAPARILPIAGVYKTECKPIGKNGRHGFITTLQVEGKTLTATTQIYAHSSCDIPTVVTTYRGTITAARKRPDGSIDFDHVVKAITMTPNHAEVVSIYNGSGDSGCGFGGGWALGVERSVAGRFCAPFAFPALGTRLYERAWLSQIELRIGSFPMVWNNTTPDKRPATPGLMVFHLVAM